MLRNINGPVKKVTFSLDKFHRPNILFPIVSSSILMCFSISYYNDITIVSINILMLVPLRSCITSFYLIILKDKFICQSNEFIWLVTLKNILPRKPQNLIRLLPNFFTNFTSSKPQDNIEITFMIKTYKYLLKMKMKEIS